MMESPRKVSVPAVVVYGPGRSGTTLLYRLLSQHPEFGWVSSYVNRFPTFLSLSAMNRLYRRPAVEQWGRDRRFLPHANEAYDFWRHYLYRFTNPGGHEENPRPDRTEAAVLAIEKILRFGGGNQFLAKFTGWLDLEPLRTVLGEFKVIYIHRDPRAVVYSYFAQKNWRIRGNSRMERLSECAMNYERSYLEYGRLERYPHIELQMEALIKDPVTEIQKATQFAGVTANDAYLAFVKSWKLRENPNAVWKRELSDDEQAMLTEKTARACAALGYA